MAHCASCETEISDGIKTEDGQVLCAACYATTSLENTETQSAALKPVGKVQKAGAKSGFNRGVKAAKSSALNRAVKGGAAKSSALNRAVKGSGARSSALNPAVKGAAKSSPANAAVPAAKSSALNSAVPAAK